MAPDHPQDDRAAVLVVDDELNNLDLAERALASEFTVHRALSTSEADEILESQSIAVILSDLEMPQGDGVGFLARVSETHPRLRRLLCTANLDAKRFADAINRASLHGIVTKPWKAEELRALIRAQAQEFAMQDESLETLRAQKRKLEAQVTTLSQDLLSSREALDEGMAQLSRQTREFERLSYRDRLTELYNHRAFRERMEEELARARRYEQPLSLIFADLDNFSHVNEHYGYEVGDETLRRLAALLFSMGGRVRNRQSDIAARYEGQRFALLLPETSKKGAVVKGERLREAVTQAGLLDEELSMSFGVASFPDDCSDAEKMIRASISALRVAKRSGKNQVAVFGDSRASMFRDDDDDDTIPPLPPLTKPLAGPTMFPSHHQRLPEIIGALERDRAVACLYVDLSQLRRIQQEFGLARHAALFTKAGTLLHSLQGSKLRRDDLICRTEVDDAYVCFLSPARHPGRAGYDSVSDLEAIAQRIEEVLDDEIGSEIKQLGSDRPRITVGFSRVLLNPLMRAERLVAKLIEDARSSAEMMRQRTIHRDKSELQELILGNGLTPVYQPIVSLESCDVFGFESLTRGPPGTRLESPIELFGIADEVDLTFELDRACFRGALRAAHALEPVHRLFVNVLPLSFYDASFIEEEVARLLEEADLRPANLVFEITERLAIENFSSFRRALARYTAMGFGVAIDDVGTRHSNLETVMALRPHFIKVSDVLTQNVARSTVKREMMRSLGRIAEAIDAVIVAEGIEDPEDLAVLSDLGVKYGQGFFLARPGPPFPSMSDEVRQAVHALGRAAHRPIPAPTAEFDEEGDPRAAPGQIGIRQAVIERAGNELERPEAMLEKLRAKATERNSAPDWATGSKPAFQPVEPALDPDYDPPDTGTHKIDGQFLEWNPLSVKDLGGGEREAAKASLLDSLKSRRTQETEPSSED